MPTTASRSGSPTGIPSTTFLTAWTPPATWSSTLSRTSAGRPTRSSDWPPSSKCRTGVGGSSTTTAASSSTARSGTEEAGFVLFRVTMDVKLSTRERLDRLFKQRIAIFDGSMGVMLQHKGLSDEEFRGERFRDHPKALRNNSDILCLTQPDLVSQVHREYLEAGADIVTTNTFTATRVSQADYGLEDYVYEMNLAGARLARQAADRFGNRFVAGSL